jgi:hypothetical protein
MWAGITYYLLDSEFKRANHSRRNVEIPANLFSSTCTHLYVADSPIGAMEGNGIYSHEVRDGMKLTHIHTN